MLYPVYVHMGDEDHAHGITIPDFPCCFSAADAWDMIPAMVQEAVEVHFDGEDLNIPPPSPLEELVAKEAFQGGVWMLVDIDPAHISPKSLRFNVTLPEPLVRRIDGYAKAHHMSRSGFLARAAEEILEPHS
ncbi:MAG: type II toxin-antitoxin system HicB family antitoxin [Magnetococcales bacterium]|nr:type II toxin-antitoxin system HicB family antitoxin [Magnetococcales bacterium]MBF0149171.1 type II toxin-antitoxin system HicB family antitoxin [Magnetococcales bacterium]